MIQKIKWSSTRICFKTSLGLPTAHIRLQNDDLTIWSYMWFPNFAGILRGTRAHPILRRRSIHTYMYIYIYNPLYIARVFPKNRWYMYIHILIHQHIYIYIFVHVYMYLNIDTKVHVTYTHISLGSIARVGNHLGSHIFPILSAWFERSCDFVIYYLLFRIFG